jgi:polyphosphate kinase
VLKKTLLSYIDNEIENHSEKQPGHIQFKTNALTDSDIVKALYKASQAGVTVDLLVRDSCLIRPGIKGLSENIKVVSIVGRFLEHSRIYYFKHQGDEKYFIGSADLMKRNLERRVEVITPVEDQKLRKQLREFLDLQFADQRGAWDMQDDGTYIQRQAPKDEIPFSSQEMLIHKSAERHAEAKQERKKKKKLMKKIAKRKK